MVESPSPLQLTGKDGGLCTVMTLAGSLSDFVQYGPSANLRAAVTKSGGIFVCFAGSCVVGMKLWAIGVPSRFMLLSRWRYLISGLVYAIVLVLHERPNRLTKSIATQ